MAPFLHSVWHITTLLAPWLLLGAAFAGLLHRVVPRGWIRRVLSGRGGVVRAAILGLPLPLCSCGVIPAGLGLKREGASDGATVAFLVSTPQTGVDSLLVSASFLGWPFAFFKLVVAFLLGVMGGWLAQWWSAPETSSDLKDRAPGEALVHELGETRSTWASIQHALSLLRSIWRWLLVGIVVSAAIETFLPAQAMGRFASQGSEVWLMLAALLVSVPLYVCSTASVPIAAALVNSGFPPGAALVFLLAGPATNVATLGAVYRALGTRSFLAYLLAAVGGSLAFAILFSDAFALSGTVAHGMQHEAGLVAIPSAVLLAGLLVWFAFEDLKARFQKVQVSAVEESVKPASSGGCGHCGTMKPNAPAPDHKPIG